MNVIGSRPTGWWRDRPAAIRQLVDRLRALAENEGQDITVVIDGRPLTGLPEGESGGLTVVFASRPGQNAADDRIVELVRCDPNPAELQIITADRDLAGRIRSLGAAVSGPQELLRRLDELKPTGLK